MTMYLPKQRSVHDLLAFEVRNVFCDTITFLFFLQALAMTVSSGEGILLCQWHDTLTHYKLSKGVSEQVFLSVLSRRRLNAINKQCQQSRRKTLWHSFRSRKVYTEVNTRRVTQLLELSGESAFVHWPVSVIGELDGK